LACGRSSWHVGNATLPVVSVYKYGGVLIHSSLSWDPLLAALKHRVTVRTGELVRWSRANGMSADVLQRLWTVYVELAAAWGLGLTILTGSQTQVLNRIQRKAGRMLLGHSRRSPIPSVCFELGWKLWSSHASLLRMRLLRRIMDSSHSLVVTTASAASLVPTSWTSKVISFIRGVRPAGVPISRSDWEAFLTSFSSDAMACDSEELWNSCLAHNNLASYQPGPWVMEGVSEINRMMHDHSLDAECARVVSRLFCGGQGLRGGDPRMVSQPTARTSCLHCLLNGRRVKETLHHFLFDCPLFDRIRAADQVAKSWQRGKAICCLHRDCWSFRQIRIITRSTKDMWQTRRDMLRTEGSASRRRVSERAEELWSTAH
jgi:hypothetical protein